MAKQVNISNTQFSTKKEAKEYIRNIISRYDSKTDLSGNDLVFITDLLAIHPESRQKIGCGITRIYVDLDLQYKRNKCFFIQRKDGSTTDFSWVACIDGRNKRREVFDAFRNAVNDQIEEFKIKQLQYSLTCPYTKEVLHNGNAHVDHKAPSTFYVLVKTFLNFESKNIAEVRITEPEDNQFTTFLTDESFMKRWELFHQKNAKLRLLSRTGNLSSAKHF